MSRSGQLTLRFTVESNYSSMSTCLAGASVTRDHALDTCEPSCVSGAARPFFIPVVHSPLGVAGYVVAPELSSRGGKAGATSGAVEHVAALKLSSRGGRGQSHGTRGSAGAHLGREARSGAEEHVAAPELNSARR
jgi:hypothetical protein